MIQIYRVFKDKNKTWLRKHNYPNDVLTPCIWMSGCNWFDEGYLVTQSCLNTQSLLNYYNWGLFRKPTSYPKKVVEWTTPIRQLLYYKNTGTNFHNHKIHIDRQSKVQYNIWVSISATTVFEIKDLMSVRLKLGYAIAIPPETIYRIVSTNRDRRLLSYSAMAKVRP